MRNVTRRLSGTYLRHIPYDYMRNREYYRMRTFRPLIPWWVKKDWSNIDISNFDPDRKSSHDYLTMIANGMLYQQSKTLPFRSDPMVLNLDMYRRRKSYEINPVEGVPDPAVVSGLYWRTHPEGLKFHNQDERIKTGNGFYAD